VIEASRPRLRRYEAGSRDQGQQAAEKQRSHCSTFRSVNDSGV
jgi:hypothetical protein